MYSVGVMAKKSGLSRTALLYYDRIGLLRPSGRSAANYRLYSEADMARLDKISLYRAAGLPLRQIGQLLDAHSFNDAAVQVLERRLADINVEIGRARHQQQLILRLIGNEDAFGSTRILSKQDWTALLRATGLSDRDMDRWHREFERLSPGAHQDFLQALGMKAEEITRLRQWAANAAAEAADSPALNT